MFSTDDLALTGEGREATRIEGLLWTAPDTAGLQFDLDSLTLETPPTDRFAIGRPALTVTSAHLADVTSFFESLQVGDSRMTGVSLSALEETTASVTGSELAESTLRAGLSGSSLQISDSTLRVSEVTGSVVTLSDSTSTGGSVGGLSSLAVRRSELIDTSLAISGDLLIEDSRVQLPPGPLLGLDTTIRRSWVTGSGDLNGLVQRILVEESTVSARSGSVITLGSSGGEIELVNATVHGDIERGRVLQVRFSTVIGELLETGGGPPSVSVVGSYVESCGSLGGPFPGFVTITASLDSDGSCVRDEDLGVDPQLGPLADNGGTTPTYAPLFGSPLLDAAGGVDCPATDQRGEARPFDSTGDGSPVCDVGAVEAQEVIGVGGVSFVAVDIVEGDPLDPENRPIEVSLDRVEPLDVQVRVTAIPPSTPQTELLQIDNDCDPGVDVATFDNFDERLDPGTTVLPILICADEQPEGVGRFEVEILAEPTQELLASATFVLSDDDLVLIEGPTEVVEGGVELNDIPFPVDLLTLSLRPERTVYDYSYTLGPDAPAGFFRVRGVGAALVPACADSSAFGGDVELGSWEGANGTGTLTTCGDPIPEPPKPFVIEYVASSGVIVESFPVTLIDDDSPVAMSASPVELDEPPASSNSRVVGVPIQLDQPTTRPVQVFVRLEPVFGGAVPGAPGGTCEADVEYLAELVNLPAGATEFSVPVEVCADGLLDPDGSIALVVVMPGAPFSDLVRVPITIIDANDSIPRVSVTDAVVVEGDAGEVFAEVDLVATGGATPFAVTWNARTLPTGATGRPASTPSDFTGSTGNVIGFPVGGGTETISIPVQGDTIAEGDELFRVTISANGAQVIDDTATVRIIDDDALRVSVLDAADVVEGDAGTVDMTFTLVLDAEPSGTVSVQWETHGISGVPPDDPALATGFGPDRDFDAALGTATFSPGGPLAREVTISVRGDESDESTENVYLLVRGVSGAGDPVIGDGQGIGRIIDDDDLPVRLDTEPPVFIGVADLDVTIPERQSAVLVSWNIRATDDVDGEVSHTCSPAAKTSFGLGDTTVTVHAVDAAGNEASTTFVVSVATNRDQQLTDQAGAPSHGSTRIAGSSRERPDSCEQPGACRAALGARAARVATGRRRWDGGRGTSGARRHRGRAAHDRPAGDLAERSGPRRPLHRGGRRLSTRMHDRRDERRRPPVGNAGARCDLRSGRRRSHHRPRWR